MKPFTRIATLVILMLAGAAVGSLAVSAADAPAPPKQASWRDYRAKDAGFAILMPGDPTISPETLDNGKVLLSYEVDLGPTYYSVSYNEIAAGWRQQTTEDGMLDKTRDGAVNAVKGTIRVERKFNFGEVRARELVYDTPDKFTLMQRHYLYGDRLFQVTYVGPLNSESKAEVKRFFDSFRFISQ
jgi:hypothetical protein